MYVKIHVIPESTIEAVKKEGDIVYVSVHEKPEHGAANRKMSELLRAYFGNLCGKRIRIVGGHHAPHKIISIEG